MSSKTLSVPEEALISMLKTIPEDVLVDIFWKTLVESDVSPLTKEERDELEKGKREFEKGETVKWKNLK